MKIVSWSILGPVFVKSKEYGRRDLEEKGLDSFAS